MPKQNPRERRYQPLADYLTMQRGDEVVLSFAEVEAILRAPLPASAYGSQWWTSTAKGYSHSGAWRAAGWEATAITWHDGERWVTFRRR